MYKAKVGISTHYFGRHGNVDSLAERFDVETVANQAAEAGAGWFLYTIHHQPWAMMAPNGTYDQLVGNSEFTATRDLPAELANALRAGNPDTLIAFNPGVIEKNGIQRYSKQDDYTAGEANSLKYIPDNQWIDGAQCHLWTYLGDWWSHSGLRFSDEKITNYARKVIGNDGVMTFEVGTQGKLGKRGAVETDPNSVFGKIDSKQIEQIKRIVDSLDE